MGKKKPRTDMRTALAPDRPTRIGRDRWGRTGWLVWIDGAIVARGLPTAEAAREKLAALLAQ